MSNWYAYKVLADTIHADRRAVADRHRQAREARLADADLGSVNDPRQARHALAATRPVASSAAARSARWPALVATGRVAASAWRACRGLLTDPRSASAHPASRAWRWRSATARRSACMVSARTL
jgi:hypothetical protein